MIFLAMIILVICTASLAGCVAQSLVPKIGISCQPGYILGTDNQCHQECGSGYYCPNNSICCNNSCYNPQNGYYLGEDCKFYRITNDSQYLSKFQEVSIKNFNTMKKIFNFGKNGQWVELQTLSTKHGEYLINAREELDAIPVSDKLTGAKNAMQVSLDSYVIACSDFNKAVEYQKTIQIQSRDRSISSALGKSQNALDWYNHTVDQINQAYPSYVGSGS